MEKDIRELFDAEEFLQKKLPADHELEFIQKLKEQKPEKKRAGSFFLKIAASIAIIFTIGYFTINVGDSQTELQKQVAQIEKNYLKQIDQEWKTFEQTAKDPKDGRGMGRAAHASAIYSDAAPWHRTRFFAPVQQGQAGRHVSLHLLRRAVVFISNKV